LGRGSIPLRLVEDDPAVMTMVTAVAAELDGTSKIPDR
jgi:hypothetical protein